MRLDDVCVAGTERPGAVYLAAALAAHSQKGIPAFAIYGQDVQDAGDTSIPADVEEKLLRFARAGLAVARMKRKSYPKNFKLGAINQVKAGKSISKVSKELGIIPTMLSRWIYEYRELGEKAFSGIGNKIQNKDYEIEKLKK